MSNPPISDFPPDVLDLIKENSNPQQSFKLMKANKFFQLHPFPFTIVDAISNLDILTEEGPKTILSCHCENKPSILGKIENVPDDLWLLNVFCLKSCINVISQFVPKIVYCEIQVLKLEKQKLSWDEYIKLTEAREIECLDFNRTSVKGENEKTAPLEDLLVTLPKAEKLL